MHSWPSLEEHEKNYILDVLDETAGNRSKAAKILQIDRVSLWRKIKRYGLDIAEN
jgi:transcriptional regulator with PAS, ATPase and Fis domain